MIRVGAAATAGLVGRVGVGSRRVAAPSLRLARSAGSATRVSLWSAAGKRTGGARFSRDGMTQRVPAPLSRRARGKVHARSMSGSTSTYSIAGGAAGGAAGSTFLRNAGALFGGIAVAGAWHWLTWDGPLNALKRMPFSGLVTTAAGFLAMVRLAPHGGVLVRLFGLIAIGTSVGMMKLGSVIRDIDRAVSLREDERLEFHQQLVGVLNHHQCASGEKGGRQKLSAQDEKAAEKALLTALKWSFLGLYHLAGSTATDEHGRPVLTREALAAAEKKILETKKLADAGKKADAQISDEAAKEAHKMATLLMNVLDTDDDGTITIGEYVSGALLVAASAEEPEARARLWFRALDVNHNGSISRPELLHWVRMLQACDAVSGDDATVRDWVGGSRPATADEIVDRWLSRYDTDADGVIGPEEFAELAQEVDFSPVIPSNPIDMISALTGADVRRKVKEGLNRNRDKPTST